jgi:hypothetical protein
MWIDHLVVDCRSKARSIGTRHRARIEPLIILNFSFFWLDGFFFIGPGECQAESAIVFSLRFFGEFSICLAPIYKRAAIELRRT